MSEQVTTETLLRFLNNENLTPMVNSFNRLEGLPRSHHFDQALKAEIRDPLWMLCKQWQMGEFQGDDAGSPVSAKVSMSQTRLTKFQSGTGQPRAFDDSLPLEAQVEQRPIAFSAGQVEMSLDLRLLMGRQWRKLLLKAGYGNALIRAYIEQFATFEPDPENRDHAGYCADKDAWRQHQAAAKRHIDGKKLYDSIIEDPEQHPELVAAPVNEHPALMALAERFVRWFDKLYLQPALAEQDAWNPKKLEYSFACSAPKPDGEQVYRSEAYYQGHLDWYNLSIDGARETLGEVADEVIPDDLNQRIVRSFIPAQVSFAGMPNTRWWTFEQGDTNFGDINPDTTDINKLLLMEFALIYANDWFMLPLTMTAGNILNVSGLSVKNVFGEHIWIAPTGQGFDDSPNRWTMYSLDIIGNDIERADLSLLMLPSVPKIQQGKPVEQIQLTRDESANMVWGIETIVPLPSGVSVPGREAGRATRNFISRIVLDGVELEAPAEAVADLRYQVMSTVPEHWIPFIATHTEGDNRTVQLQRGSMPRVIEGDNTPVEKVKPRTDLLRFGLNQQIKQPYFIHEEEVPRGGAIVSQSFQRTRWYNGEVYTWLGARKRTGRGESSSQLQFDYLQSTK